MRKVPKGCDSTEVLFRTGICKVDSSGRSYFQRPLAACFLRISISLNGRELCLYLYIMVDVHT